MNKPFLPFLSAIALAGSFSAANLFAQTPATNSAVRNPAILPVTRSNPTNWMSRHEGFVALAKKGHPYMGAMVVEDAVGRVPQIMLDALKEQQRIDLERSFEYARKKLNVGINWRG